jgi:solute carrier family 25 S-adenosylmethionine transporter 26
MKGQEQGRGGGGIHFHLRLPQLENVNLWRGLENTFRLIWENGKGKAKRGEEVEAPPKGANSVRIRKVNNRLSVVERAMIGACAGGIAGAFTYVCLHPLDTVKTKLQMRGASQLYAGLGTVEVMGRVLKENGIGGLYSGVSAVLVGSTISSAIYFGTCEFAKAFLISKTTLLQIPSLAIPPVAGALGNVVSSAVMVPKELITQRMQAGAPGRSWQVLLATVEREGIWGLYAGYSATILRNLPTGVLSFSSFEYLKAAVLNKTKKPHLEPLQSVCCGALAGAISAFLTTPLDVVKTRLMTQGIGIKAGLKNEIAASAYKGFSSTLHQIWREEGWLGLTRGIGPRVLHSSCFAALGYFAFETARLTILELYLARKVPPALSLEADNNRD